MLVANTFHQLGIITNPKIPITGKEHVCYILSIPKFFATKHSLEIE